MISYLKLIFFFDKIAAEFYEFGRNKIINHPYKNAGIYKFLGLNKDVLYIGKAKNLHNRLSSYFRISKTTSPKLKNLISEAKFLNIIITDSELEALLLEQHEIKEHRPKYNVVFKDDKGYPWIRVSISKNYPSVTLFRGKNLIYGPKFFLAFWLFSPYFGQAG